MTASERLRKLLDDTWEPLTSIAQKAGVPYDPLWRWINSKSSRGQYDLDHAERVYSYLTGGKSFIEDET